MLHGKIRTLQPPACIGIIGGGQLGRMLTMEAKRMGYKVIILDPKPNSPAGQVADEQIEASFSDTNAIRELANRTEVMTYEFEHINAEILCSLESEGYRVYPSGKTLMKIQNKYKQKCMLKNASLKVPKFSAINGLEDLNNKFNEFNSKVILKTCSGGYDGKGNVVISDINNLQQAYQELSDYELMVEEFITYTKELSIIIAKNNDETIAFYPIAENVHKDSILIKSIVPARISNELENEIKDIAKKVIETLDDTGIFCIELFIDSKSSIIINEIAPRPHNSGHYTIEGCITSQFEQLIRIITGMPLGSTKLESPCAMVNILGDSHVNGNYSFDGIESVLKEENCHLHLYGKLQSFFLKKLGHITALDDSSDKAEIKANNALKNIRITSI